MLVFGGTRAFVMKASPPSQALVSPEISSSDEICKLFLEASPPSLAGLIRRWVKCEVDILFLGEGSLALTHYLGFRPLGILCVRNIHLLIACGSLALILSLNRKPLGLSV